MYLFLWILCQNADYKNQFLSSGYIPSRNEFIPYLEVYIHLELFVNSLILLFLVESSTSLFGQVHFQFKGCFYCVGIIINNRSSGVLRKQCRAWSDAAFWVFTVYCVPFIGR